MMHMAVGRLEVIVSLAERATERVPERQTAARQALVQRSYDRDRTWQAVESERAAWDTRSQMLRSGIAR